MHMDMGTSTTAAAMATSTMDMSSSSSDSSMSMPMTMTFFSATDTPLFADPWTPSTTGQYAGTCIFLIVLGALLRLILALRPILETRFWNTSAPIPTTHHAKEASASDEEHQHEYRSQPRGPRGALALAGSDMARRWSGWSVGIAAARATYELVIAGVGYLLMLAIMTMNVGYFIAVLAGIWLGTFFLGGLAYDERWGEHC